jgi:DNA-directed RNA polymerase specialized sigma24 family protein
MRIATGAGDPPDDNRLETLKRMLEQTLEELRKRHAGGPSLPAVSGERALEMFQLGGALEKLRQQDARVARAIELRFIDGLPVQQVAKELDLPRRTVERELHFGKTWIARQLGAGR